jgi:hypothetical protein
MWIYGMMKRLSHSYKIKFSPEFRIWKLQQVHWSTQTDGQVASGLLIKHTSMKTYGGGEV